MRFGTSYCELQFFTPIIVLMIENFELDQTLSSIEVQLGPASLADLPRIADLEASWCATDPATYEDFLNFYKNRRLTDFLEVARTPDGELIGFIGFSFNAQTNSCNIWNLAVYPAHQNSGIATLLVQYAIAAAKKGNCYSIHLNVSENNKPALKLYEKLHFKRMYFKKEYYGYNDGCYNLEYALTDHTFIK